MYRQEKITVGAHLGVEKQTKSPHTILSKYIIKFRVIERNSGFATIKIK